MIVIGLFGKLGAFFVGIPAPVLGGLVCVLFGKKNVFLQELKFICVGNNMM